MPTNAIDVVISDLIDYCDNTDKLDYGKMCFINLLTTTKIYNCIVVDCEVKRAENTRHPMFDVLVSTQNKKVMTSRYFLTSYQYFDFRELFEKYFSAVKITENIVEEA